MQKLPFLRFYAWFGQGLCLLWVAAGISAHAQTWQNGDGFRSRLLAVPGGGKAGFAPLPPKLTGLSFTNVLPEPRSLTNQNLSGGSGVAAGDIDGDGWCDLFFAGLGGGSRLYRNLGQWHFADITEAAGINCRELDATGAVFTDIDGDGDLDLLVSSFGGGTHVFLNEGKGHFSRGPTVLNAGRGGTSMALADLAGRGWLDLYQANYRVDSIADAPGTRFGVKMINGQPVVAAVNGRPLTDPQWTNRFRFRIQMAGGRGRFAHEELGEPDVLFRNDGKGNFIPAGWTTGQFLDETGQPLSEPPFDWGLTATFRDFNGDGLPDLYVCNDFSTPDRFWLNQGGDRFQACSKLALRDTSLSSMSLDVADLNRDGYDDFIVVDMLSRDHRRRLTQRRVMHAETTLLSVASERPQYSRNTLFLSRGDGTYAEVAQFAGLDASEWSWAPVFLDVDLDGYEDLLISSGFERDNMNVDAQKLINQAKGTNQIHTIEELQLRRLFPRLATGNLAFRNRGNLRFEEVTREWGFGASTVAQGTCLADLDNDGDLDLVVNNLNDAAGIYRNETAAPRLAVRVAGQPPNTHGIGARITVMGGPVAQSQEMMCGGRYLSCDDTLRVFAAGSLTNRLRIEVAWRSGRHSVVSNALPNTLYEILEPAAGVPVALAKPAEPAPLFEDVSERLGHTNQDEAFDDYSRQPLLPKRLSSLGPGVSWWDMDGDGWDDLLIGSGKGGQLAYCRNDRQGGFQRVMQLPWTAPVTRDQTTIVGWGSGSVLVGSANYEDGLVSGGAVQGYTVGQVQVVDLVSVSDSSVGPLALADYDRDGALDLFVGGRVKAGQYPLAASSQCYRQRGGKLVLDEENSGVLKGVGLVSGAVWSDLDGDGWPELILACEWGPVRAFHNERGRLREITADLGLAQFTGWWNGVTTGDLDGDGRPDIIATNWGENGKYQRYRGKPLRIYYGDFNQDGSMGLLEGYYDSSRGEYVPGLMLDIVSKAIPSVTERFATHEAWAAAGIEQVLGARHTEARILEAACLESSVFLNRGGRFERRPLPLEAQLAPAFAACVADYDGDGNEDLFLSQNFFAVDAQTSRYDAGRGLLLRGDGQGNFHAVPGQESGVRVYGEQRGAAAGDFDGDGRVDLVVTQNGDQTRLFRNVRARPGLRVRVQGPPGNPQGIGAVVRLKYGEQFGPAVELHAGAGYWCQDSTVAVLGSAKVPTELLVRWPGGATTTAKLPPQVRQVTAGPDGKLSDLR